MLLSIDPNLPARITSHPKWNGVFVNVIGIHRLSACPGGSMVIVVRNDGEDFDTNFGMQRAITISEALLEQS